MMSPDTHLNRLRRLRLLQVLERVAPDPMGELALLNAVRVDPELSPTIERVRQSLRYLGESGLAEVITVSGSDWIAGRITPEGLMLLTAANDDDAWKAHDIYCPAEKPEAAQDNRRGRISSVKTLPTEAKAWLDQELVRRHFTGYVELADLLAEQGYEISKSALGRYGKQYKEELKELRQTVEMAKGFAEVVGDDAGALTQTLVSLAQQELITIVRDGTYNKDDIDLPAVINSIARLSRADVHVKRYAAEVKAKTRTAAKEAEKIARAGGLSADRRSEIKKLITSIAS